MLVSKKDREYLNFLSKKVYGASSRWMKMIDRVYVGDGYEVDEKETAKAKAQAQDMKNNGIEAEEIDTVLSAGWSVRKYKKRKLTPKEMILSLENVLDGTEYAQMDAKEGAVKAASQVFEKKLSSPISLFIKEEERGLVDNMLSELEEIDSKTISRIISTEHKKDVYNVDGLTFLETYLNLKAESNAKAK